jgi:hypothetical protein
MLFQNHTSKNIIAICSVRKQLLQYLPNTAISITHEGGSITMAKIEGRKYDVGEVFSVVMPTRA